MESRWKCAVFDCDGVLLDSNGVKVRAFYDAMGEEPPEWVDAFVAEHRKSGGVSRYEKLRRYFEELHPRPNASEALERAVQAFGESARRGLRECAPVPGVRELLTELSRSGVPCVVASGGDEAEVSEALGHHELARFFERILGSPTRKAEHMHSLVESGWIVQPGVFFGDAKLDMELAEGSGLEFVFVAGVSDWTEGAEVAAARGHRVIADFREL